jgi:YD repeat-containing protein
METPPDEPKREKDRLVPTASIVLADGEIVEMVYDATGGLTRFVAAGGETWRFEAQIESRPGEKLVPFSATNNLLVHEVVLLPAEPVEYGDERQLLARIRDFIHRYVDVSPIFEELTAYYVLLSWLYDCFYELPYLRVRGDYGSGKTRFLLVVGAVCYKPMFASGASTTSPLFRTLDAFRGTLILDESDFRLSDDVRRS